MPNTTVTAPKGFLAAAVHCGIKTTDKPDLAILTSRVPATAAAVFTTNKVVGAPIIVGRRQMRRGLLRACIVNAGCANVCTGQRGLDDAEEMCVLAAAGLNSATAGDTTETDGPAGADMRDILPSSTGIIGHYLPMDKIRTGVPQLVARLSDSPEAGQAFAEGILTTDLRTKTAHATFQLNGRAVTIAGCCKGSGMIAPNMATMLAYVASDASITGPALRQIVRLVADETFNCVSVDQHTSTSDTFAVLSNGLAENRTILAGSAGAKKFRAALTEVCDSLSRQIAADGEGATKLVHVRVVEAAGVRDARRAAFAIANSPLVKTAIHGGDPNWGRFVSAAGYSGARMNVEKSFCSVGDVTVFKDGRPTDAPLSGVQAQMRGEEVHITVGLGFRGKNAFRVYTCDLSREYITINADYHT